MIKYKRTIYRVLAGLALMISLLFLPWGVTAALVIIFIIYFDWYYEAIGAGFIADSLYAASIPSFGGFLYIGTLTSILLFLIALFAKSRIRYFS